MKNIYDVKRIQELYDLYGSMRRVAKITHMSRNTVRKYLMRIEAVREGKMAKIIERKRVEPHRRVMTEEVIKKIHGYLEENRTKHRKLRYTAKKIRYMLLKQGYRMSYSTVRREVKRWKEENLPGEKYVLQDTKLGKRAEFDWGETELVVGGKKAMYHVAFMVLNNTLYRFARVYKSEGIQQVIDTHMKFFEEIRGVPKVMVYDNLKVVVDNAKEKRLNKGFMGFSNFYGFQIQPCNPSSPNEKGTDEETVGFVRRWVFSERDKFADMKQANEYVREKLIEINSNPVFRRGITPIEGIKQERRYLMPLPTAEYCNYRLESRQVNKYSLINFDKNSYSVPETYPKKAIMLKVYPDRIEMVDEDKVIATHVRVFGRGKYVIDITHYVETLKRKPGALANSKALQVSHTALQVLYHRYYTTRAKEFIEIVGLARRYDERRVTRIIEELMEQGVEPTYDIIENLVEQKDSPGKYMEYPKNIEVDPGEPEEFDALLRVGGKRG